MPDPTPKQPKTYREACEIIARSEILTKPDGTHPTAKEIFEYSQHGELLEIPGWFILARQVLEERERQSDPNTSS